MFEDRQYPLLHRQTCNTKVSVWIWRNGWLLH